MDACTHSWRRGGFSWSSGGFPWANGRRNASVTRKKGAALRRPFSTRWIAPWRIARGGQHQQARDLCCDALEDDPRSTDAWHVLGMTLYLAGDAQNALQALERAASLEHPNAAVFSNLGCVHASLGDLQAASANYRRALRLQPELPEANNNLANALRDLGELTEAQKYYREAIRLKPDYCEAWNNLGSVLEKNGAFREAEEHYQRALDLNPVHTSTLNNMGSTLARQERNGEAIAYYRRALELQPDLAATYSNLAFVFAKQGNLSEVIDLLRTAMQLDPAYASNYLFMLSKDPNVSPEELFAEHCRWGHRLQQTIVPHLLGNRPDPDRRLRIGYVSPDLRDHVVAKYIEPVLANHDPTQVEIYCYAEVFVPDNVTRHLRTLADHWRSTCGQTSACVAEMIHRDQIDILVDLAGHTANNRLGVFAHKPAPVQVAWMGYPNTTGLSTMDYRITCDFQDPVGEEQFHTERLVRLPGGSACFVPPEAAPPVAPLPALERGEITFGSLHRLDKITGATFDHWSRILAAVPDSRLLIFWPTLHGSRKEWMLEEFAARGIPKQKLDLRHETDENGYLAVYHEIDIGLDPIPWTGSTTTKEALWMGVVALALYGSRRSARGSAVVLHQIGLDELIAASPDHYVELAIQLAGNVGRLAMLRQAMRNRMRQHLRDPLSFTRGLEAAFRTMWRDWCAA